MGNIIIVVLSLLGLLILRDISMVNDEIVRDMNANTNADFIIKLALGKE